MKSSVQPDIGQVFADGTLIDEALSRGVRDALRRHKRLGHSVAIWRDGQVVWIPPEEIPVADEGLDQTATEAG